MTLIIETGAGVREANSYVDVAYITNYLTVRNRQAENGWTAAATAIKEAAAIAATDYVDTRFGAKFKGAPEFSFDEERAEGSITFSGAPLEGQTLTLGDAAYKFVLSLTGEPYEVSRSGSATTIATNLEAAIEAGPGAGVAYGLGTPQSRHSGVQRAGAALTLTAKAAGSSGSLTVLQGPLANAVIVGFSGGKDGGIQPLSWPRSSAFDQRGQRIVGIPDRLKQAVAEYAVRAVSSPLLPDPAVDPYGGRLFSRREQVGPIQEEARYSRTSETQNIFVPYPAADRLLRPLLLGSGGGVIRG